MPQTLPPADLAPVQPARSEKQRKIMPGAGRRRCLLLAGCGVGGWVRQRNGGLLDLSVYAWGGWQCERRDPSALIRACPKGGAAGRRAGTAGRPACG